MGGDHLAAFVAGMLTLKWWQWTTSRDRPQDERQFFIARKKKKAQLGRICYRLNVDDDIARRVADKWPRAWL